MHTAALKRILFICTGNCARSPMAEALLNYRGGRRFQAFSAGSNPAGFVHGMALQALHEIGVPTKGLRSKSWLEVADKPFDAVITLCGEAREAVCPAWPRGKPCEPIFAHWGFEDPAALFDLPFDEQLDAFRRGRDAMRQCIERLAVAMDTTIADADTFTGLLERIGRENLSGQDRGRCTSC